MPGKYFLLFITMLFVSILLAAFSYELSIFFDIRLAWDLPVQRADIVRQLDFTFNNGIVYQLTVSSFAVGIKMAKNFYLQQKHNEQLNKQKIEAEVQLVKNQVHPRFLFHSLNSIYNDMLNGATQSSDMLLKLSDLLSYILYESDTIMPLEKEILLLKNYVDLEQSGWGKNLITDVKDETIGHSKFIEPLLLLPLAEHVFINAERNKQTPTFLSVHMNMQGNVFQFSMQAQSKFVNNSSKENTQLTQVKKRLQAQYAGKHEFNINSDENSIRISLSLVLDKALPGKLDNQSDN